jgi:hypothetical protein
VTIRYASRMSRVRPSAIRELLQLGADPEIISFGGGYPDRALFPIGCRSRRTPSCLLPNMRPPYGTQRRMGC